MKKNLILFSFISLCLISCNDAEESLENFTTKDVQLNLISPSGDRIAENECILKEETAIIIAEQFGYDSKFEITSIEYAPLNEGYLALISYKLEDGTESNYAKCNNSEVINSSQTASVLYLGEVVPDIKQNSVITRATNAVSFKCKSKAGCTPCQVKMTIVSGFNPSFDTSPVSGGGKETLVSCNDACSDCKLEAVIK